MAVTPLLVVLTAISKPNSTTTDNRLNTAPHSDCAYLSEIGIVKISSYGRDYAVA
jgi:hypothetical protein